MSESRAKILNRLRRAQGQLGALIGSVEADAECRDVIIQLAAVSSALDRAGFLVVSAAMKECLEGSDELTVSELEELFLSLA